MDINAALDVDILISMDDEEMITNIERPSMCSFSSDESLNEDIITVNENMDHVNQKQTLHTPMEAGSIIDQSPSNDSGAGEDYNFKMPKNLSVKRYSLSNILEKQCMFDVSKSSSMLDVSTLMAFSSLRRDSYTYSNETLQSNSVATSKSKDSGFQRSTSCTSLNTNCTKRYDHVQSKVKQYIQNIKQNEALRKIQKQIDSNHYRESLGSTSFESPDTSPVSTDEPVSKKDLLSKVKELEEELKERDYVIEELEKNHSELRLKYAEAENKIDDLRIRASQNEDPLRNYITDEKVAELLMCNSKDSNKCNDNSFTKHILRNDHLPNAFIHTSPESRSSIGCYRDVKPREKTPGYSRRSDSYIMYKPERLSKSSSCNYFKEPKYEVSKSASNVDRITYRFPENDYHNIPYEKNSFAKVQQWQRSLMNLNKSPSDRLSTCYSVTDDANDTSCCNNHILGAADSGDENQSRKARRYQRNKDADKKRFRQSYPVGCKCEKFKKCRSKEELMSELAMSPVTPSPISSRRMFRRTVSFASYEDSLTSSVYDDDDSSTDSSETKAPRHESYKNFRKRMMRQRLGKQSAFAASSWNELKKAKSAGNVTTEDAAMEFTSPSQIRHKRLIDNVANEYDQLCGDDRVHCLKVHSKKYRKLDDFSKVASHACHAGGHKCRSSATMTGTNHLQRCTTGFDVPAGRTHSRLAHSKSVDDYSRRCSSDGKSRGRQKVEMDCSCLLALENLKLQEHDILQKYNDRARKHSRRLKDKEPLAATYKFGPAEK